ncbi:MAG: LamG-like jellyroll fold domain-containing protein, partial [Candidatus Thorarchaeota archaeon]
MKRVLAVLVVMFFILLLPIGSGTDFIQPIKSEHDVAPNGVDKTVLSDFPVTYSGKGGALDTAIIGTFSSNGSQWSMASTSYADDLTQGTSFSVSNASSASWSANVLVSPPSGVENVNFSLTYDMTDWKPLSLTSPTGVPKVFPTDWWYQGGVIYTTSSAIDTYGMWNVEFTGTNHLIDLTLGVSGGSLGSTGIFDISDEMTLQVNSSWITAANVGFELSDPSGLTWYTASNTTVGSTSHEIPSFTYRKDITVDNTKVFADLTDFPIVIDILDTDLHTDVQSDGDDIVFLQNGMIVPHEIELFDQNYDATHARLIAWIKVNLSNSVDTTITMYYGNPIVGPCENPEAVWTSDYNAVWHLDENAIDEQTTMIHDNSVSTEYDGNQDGNARIAGRIGYGQDFDGTNDLINVTAERGLNPVGDVSISGWFRLDTAFSSSSTTSQLILAKYLTGDDDMHIGLVGTDYTTAAVAKGSLVFKVENNMNYRMYKWTQRTSWSAGVWYHFVCTMDSTNADLNRIYINGVDNTNVTDSGSAYAPNVTYSSDWGLGGGFCDQLPGINGFLNGRLDEIRVINSIPTANWILTEYTNQVSIGTFSSTGSESTRTSPDLSIKKIIDSSAEAGKWKATARYNDSGSSVKYQVGFYQRDFTVKRNTQFSLISPGDAIGDGISEKVVGDMMYIEVQLNDSLSPTGVDGATVSMNWTVSSVPTNIIFDDLGTGRYGIAVNTSDLDTAMRWRVNIQSSHEYYNPSSTYLDVDLYHPTELSYKFVSSTPVGDDFTATLEYRDTWTDAPISGAMITFANGTAVNVVSQSNGMYNITIPTSHLTKGNHWYLLNATKSGAYVEMASSNVTFTLRAHYTAISVSGDLLTPFGQDTSISIILVDLDTGTVLDHTYVTSFSFTSSYGTEGDSGPSPTDLDYILSTNSWSLGATSVTVSLVVSNADYLAPDDYVFSINIRPHYTSVTVTGV